MLLVPFVNETIYCINTCMYYFNYRTSVANKEWIAFELIHDGGGSFVLGSNEDLGPLQSSVTAAPLQWMSMYTISTASYMYSGPSKRWGQPMPVAGTAIPCKLVGMFTTTGPNNSSAFR